MNPAEVESAHAIMTGRGVFAIGPHPNERRRKDAGRPYRTHRERVRVLPRVRHERRVPRHRRGALVFLPPARQTVAFRFRVV